jgi:amino-acid N-acetyltransferase
MRVEKARISDVPAIHELVNEFAGNGEMLPRALSEIYENLRDYFVIRDEAGKTIACVALHLSWSDLAEIKSLAVHTGHRMKKVGSNLVKACVDEAREIGIPTVFCLTYKPAFFETCGFTIVDKMELPRKIWSECFRCPKFPDCDEVALVYSLAPVEAK